MEHDPMNDTQAELGHPERPITSQHRYELLIDRDDSEVYVKTARIVARQMHNPFSVKTEHGVMRGEAGDYLATNHPEDDASSDVWPISATRFNASYRRRVSRTGRPPATTRPVFAYEGELTTDILERLVAAMRQDGVGRAESLAITKLEEAIHWLKAR